MCYNKNMRPRFFLFNPILPIITKKAAKSTLHCLIVLSVHTTFLSNVHIIPVSQMEVVTKNLVLYIADHVSCPCTLKWKIVLSGCYHSKNSTWAKYINRYMKCIKYICIYL